MHRGYPAGPEGAPVQQCTGATRLVIGVLSQDLPEVLLAVDQHVLEALAAQRPHVPLREGVRAG
jgi:hypothetical protein